MYHLFFFIIFLLDNFFGKKFFFFSCEKKRQDLITLVKQFGGTVTSTLNVKCSIVIYQNGNYNNYTKAIGFNVPVVTPKFIKE